MKLKFNTLNETNKNYVQGSENFGCHQVPDTECIQVPFQNCHEVKHKGILKYRKLNDLRHFFGEVHFLKIE